MLEVIKVPGLRYFSTSEKTDCLISRRSTTTSNTQSQPAMSFILSVKLPVFIFLITSFVYTGDGLLFIAAVNASLTILFFSAVFASAGRSFGCISNNNTCNPIQFLANGGSTYSWNYGDGINEVSVNSTQHVFAAAGTYTVKVVVTNGCGLTDSAETTVVVNNGGGAAVSTSVVNTITCAGGNNVWTGAVGGVPTEQG